MFEIWKNGCDSTLEGPNYRATAYVGQDVDGLLKLGDIKGELQKTDLRSENRFVIERFKTLAGMERFGASLNPAFEIGGTAGPGGMNYVTRQFDMPTDNVGVLAGPGGTSF